NLSDGTNSRFISGLVYDGVTDYSGIGWTQDTTDMDYSVWVTFGKYRANDSLTWDSTSSGFYYRVVKHRAGIPVGFGLATSEQAGLVKKNKWQKKTLS